MGILAGLQQRLRSILCAAMLVIGLLVVSQPVQAIGSTQNPQGGSVGLEGKVSAPPPTQAATIATPGNGQTVVKTPVTISGLCKTGLLVKVFSNNIFIGSAQCANGSYSIQADLFPGQNNLIARVYDALDQAGPDSNQVVVTFNDAQFIQFGTKVTLTSNYAQLGAPPNVELAWPLIISGGVGPYALSVDWGDGTATVLESVPFAGAHTIKHVYKAAGVYRIIVQATDRNGTTAFLQLVGVATGKVTQGTSTSGGTVAVGSGGGAAGGTTTQATVSWWVFVPILMLFPLIASTFWLGRRHELFVLRKKLERSRSGAQY